MDVKYIDIHSHISTADYGADLPSVIEHMKAAHVGTIIVGVDFTSSKEAVRIAEMHDHIYACVGSHPVDTKDFVFEESDFADLLKSPKVVAIGECGLDYFRLSGDSSSEKERQKKEFIKQIICAQKYNKPLMLHIRDAYEDAYQILQPYAGSVRGNMHFFAGTVEWAKRFIELGFTLSFTGVITFTDQYNEVIRTAPLSMIHAETDSPYIAPVPHRGTRNEPSYVIEVVRRIAAIRGIDEEDLRVHLFANAQRIFCLGE